MFMFFVGCVFATVAGACAEQAPYGEAVTYGLVAVGFFLYGAAEEIADALKGDAKEEEEEDDTETGEIGEVEGP